MGCLYLFPEFPWHSVHTDIHPDRRYTPLLVFLTRCGLYFLFISCQARAIGNFFHSLCCLFPFLLLRQTIRKVSATDNRWSRELSEPWWFSFQLLFPIPGEKQTVVTPDIIICLLISGGCWQSLRRLSEDLCSCLFQAWAACWVDPRFTSLIFSSHHLGLHVVTGRLMN